MTIVPVNLSQRSRHNITVTKIKLNLSIDMRVDSRRLLLSRSISLSSSTSSVSDRGRYPPLYAIDVDRSIWHADV